MENILMTFLRELKILIMLIIIQVVMLLMIMTMTTMTMIMIMIMMNILMTKINGMFKKIVMKIKHPIHLILKVIVFQKEYLQNR